MLDAARHIEHIAGVERRPAVLQQTLHLSAQEIEGLALGMAVDPYDDAGGKVARDQAVIVISVRQGGEEPNAGAEHVKSFIGVGVFRRPEGKVSHDAFSLFRHC
jgi:hypothetical protein